MKALGRHMIVELYGCNGQALNDVKLIAKMLKEATEAANATILSVQVHPLTPQGVSGVVVLAESHISIHTWPELGYASLDIYTCGEHTKPERALEVIREYLNPKNVNIVELKRGVLLE
ncbi:MAG TPA: adenosylmethionine decarboxylase [Thermoprotei archaeon]|nr:adenosylmethionine decarboxylase [Euryarchaeota archaeon]HDJ50739.1 adenosylmethionine decarboxylase [Thermoprotei archaeon]